MGKILFGVITIGLGLFVTLDVSQFGITPWTKFVDIVLIATWSGCMGLGLIKLGLDE